LSEAIKKNVETSRHSQAEVEEQLSRYLINARDRKGGRKERESRRKQLAAARSSQADVVADVAHSAINDS
jgi:hypothetical protein